MPRRQRNRPFVAGMSMIRSARRYLQTRNLPTRRYRNNAKIGVKLDFDGAFPITYNCKFKTATKFLLSGATIDGITLQLNSLNDYAGGFGNTVAPGKEQLLSATGPYIKYRVYKSKVTIEAINLSPTVAVQMAAYTTDNGATVTSIQDMRAQPYSLHTNLDVQGGQSKKTLVSGPTRVTTLTGRYDNEEQSANYNANPGELVYLHLQAEDLKGATNVDVALNVTIEQWAILSDRFDQVQETTA